MACAGYNKNISVYLEYIGTCTGHTFKDTMKLTDEEKAEYAMICADRDYIRTISEAHNKRADDFFHGISLRTGIYQQCIAIEGDTITTRTA
jgi:hypothetical protein